MPGRDDMVRALRERGVADERVLAAMAAVPRERFVPPQHVEQAYELTALTIGRGQTISEPGVVATMAATLDLHDGDRVLEVGSGSGYAAAVLAHLVGTAGEVVGVELRDELATPARAVLTDLGLDQVTIRTGDGNLGAPDRAPFDAISVAAMAQESIPRTLLDQLGPDGVLVGPVGWGRRGTLVRHQHGRWERLMAVGFVPLIRPSSERRR